MNRTAHFKKITKNEIKMCIYIAIKFLILGKYIKKIPKLHIMKKLWILNVISFAPK